MISMEKRNKNSYNQLKLEGENACLFSFWIKDKLTNKGIPGAVFELSDARKYTLKKSSDQNGLVVLRIFPYHTYFLKELEMPEGYIKSNKQYRLEADYSGNIRVDQIFYNSGQFVIFHQREEVAYFSANRTSTIKNNLLY